MVRNWDLSKKYHFFTQLTQNLAENRSSIPSLRLFKGLIKDQKEKYAYSGNSTTNYSSSNYSGYPNYNNYGGYSGGSYNAASNMTTNVSSNSPPKNNEQQSANE